MCISAEEKLLSRLLEACWDEKGNGKLSMALLNLTCQFAQIEIRFERGHQHFVPDAEDPEKEWSSRKAIPYYFSPRSFRIAVKQLATNERKEARVLFIRCGDGKQKGGGKIKRGKELIELVRLPSGKYEIHWYVMREESLHIQHRFEEREIVE